MGIFTEKSNNNYIIEYEPISEEDKKRQYQSLKTGDIIWAKRYQDEKNMLEIKKGHREGPYIILEKTDSFLQCLYCTTTAPKKVNSKIMTVLEFTDIIHKKDKTTYVHINKVIPISYDRFIQTSGTMTPEDKKSLYKKVGIFIEQNFYFAKDFNIPIIPLEPSDIICVENKKYLIISENDSYFTAEELFIKQISQEYIVLDNKRYYLNFAISKTFDKREINHKNRTSFISNKALIRVLKMQKERVQFLENMSSISRGTIVSRDNKLYYIYGENGNDWQAFPIFEKQEDFYCDINIGKKTYYTNFSEQIKISKNEENVIIIDKAIETEMSNLSARKKSYIKSGAQCKSLIQEGSLIKREENTPVYIVISKTPTKIVMIKKKDYMQHFYNFRYFDFKTIVQVGELGQKEFLNILLDIQANSRDYKKYLEKTVERLLEKMDKQDIYPNNVIIKTVQNETDTPIKPGDIFKDNLNTKLIIGEKDNDFYVMTLLSESNTISQFIKIEDKAYYLCLDFVEKYSKEELKDTKRFFTLPTKLYSSVLKMHRRRLEYIKSLDFISIGALLNINNNMCYVYGETETDWLAFKVSTTREIGSCHMPIKNIAYYTNFKETIEIPKAEENIPIIAKASKEKRKFINKLREEYSREETFEKIKMQ